MAGRLFPALDDRSGKIAMRFGARTISYQELAGITSQLAADLAGQSRVAVLATPTVETGIAVVACLLAGVPAIPVNPKAGPMELAHIVTDGQPSLLLHGEATPVPAALADVPGREVTLAGSAGWLPPEPAPETPALIIYTSGTTGPPKGVVLPRRAIIATLDALADAWQWTADDIVTHALPLFHVHGLILGILGPLRRGGTVHHLGRFATSALARAITDGATMVFGVPTMYHRVAIEVATVPALATALRTARLLVSGSAPLPVHDHERVAAGTGQRIVERYGMTETLMNTSVRADGERKPGTVGVPLPGVDLRLVDDDDTVIKAENTIGEIQVRGANLFTEYLNRPDATKEAFDDGWFRTGDLATVDADGYVRIVGRRATDLIKSSGYKIGAGEVENALLDHPGVTEVAVTGEPDPDLGERIVAWVVPAGVPPTEQELVDHVASQLSPHKRPRVIHFLEALPRNEMGKVMKRSLGD